MENDADRRLIMTDVKSRRRSAHCRPEAPMYDDGCKAMPGAGNRKGARAKKRRPCGFFSLVVALLPHGPPLPLKLVERPTGQEGTGEVPWEEVEEEATGKVTRGYSHVLYSTWYWIPDRRARFPPSFFQSSSVSHRPDRRWRAPAPAPARHDTTRPPMLDSRLFTWLTGVEILILLYCTVVVDSTVPTVQYH